jgi:hypothetical protein
LLRIFGYLCAACAITCASTPCFAQSDDSASTIARAQKTLDEIDHLVSAISARNAQVIVSAPRTTVTRTSAPGRTTNPETSLSEINAWYSDQLKKARDAKVQVDFAGLQKERTAKAKAAVAGVDVSKKPAAECLAWAQIYQAAQMQKEMLVAAARFVASNPDNKLKFQGQQIMLQGYQSTEDADGLIRVLSVIKAPDVRQSAMLAAQAANNYGETISSKRGAKTALDLISKLESGISVDELRKEDETTRSQAKPGTRAFSLADYLTYALANGRSEILEGAGKKGEALSILATARQKLSTDSPYAKSIDGKLKLAKLPGSPAPELVQERGYGGFSSLANLKGKVVILDFTAHW